MSDNRQTESGSRTLAEIVRLATVAPLGLNGGFRLAIHERLWTTRPILWLEDATGAPIAIYTETGGHWTANDYAGPPDPADAERLRAAGYGWIADAWPEVQP